MIYFWQCPHSFFAPFSFSLTLSAFFLIPLFLLIFLLSFSFSSDESFSLTSLLFPRHHSILFEPLSSHPSFYLPISPVSLLLSFLKSFDFYDDELQWFLSSSFESTSNSCCRWLCFCVYRNVPGQSAMTFTQENDGMLVKELLDKVLVERLAPLKRGYYFSKKLYKASSN